MRFAVWPSQGEECGKASGELTVRWGRFAIRAKKALVQCVGIGIRRETWVK